MTRMAYPVIFVKGISALFNVGVTRSRLEPEKRGDRQSPILVKPLIVLLFDRLRSQVCVTIGNEFVAASVGPPPPNEFLTKNLRNGDLGEFGKCRNRAVGRRILK